MSRSNTQSMLGDRTQQAIETTVRKNRARSVSFYGAPTINQPDNRHLNMCLAPTYPKRFKRRPKEHPPLAKSMGSTLFKVAKSRALSQNRRSLPDKEIPVKIIDLY